jgi:hypothetical protein
MQMSVRYFFIQLFISFLLCEISIAQKPAVKKDSTTLYRNIESFSKGSKFKSIIYGMVFKPLTADSKIKDKSKRGKKKLVQKPYSSFEGKIIRKIEIASIDPFGYSIADTTISKQSFFNKAGNSLHVKTQGIAIRNLLLIRKNEPFNSLLVKESERLIRIQEYVNEVFLYVVSAGPKSDSVDIIINELDKWSIIPEGSVSSSGFRVGLTDKNILGTGHEFENVFSRNYINRNNSFATTYSIPNIRNTYINTRLHYAFDGNNNFARSLIIERPFFSPLAKWAAGVSLAAMAKNDSLKYLNLVYSPPDLKFKVRDLWAGKAFNILPGDTANELVTNLILSARYYRIRFSEKPSDLYDHLHYYSNEDFYLFSIGISSRKYVQDRYVFKFGVTEDVPVGRVIGLTGGYQIKNNSGRPYLGLRISNGDYNRWGYLSSTIEYGTFFQSSHAEQGVLTAGVEYFSDLFGIGRWKFRQFVKPQLTLGLNRFSPDSLTLNEGKGLNGFKSIELSGTKRLVFTLQTQSYPPWNLIGFRFGPFLSYTLGILGDSENGFKSSKIYSQIGIGVLIKNENLVFNMFQVSISFYPLIPGVGQDIFKMNSFRTIDFGFRDFEFGKPDIVNFF